MSQSLQRGKISLRYLRKKYFIYICNPSYTWLLQNVTKIALFLRSTKKNHHLSHISIQIVDMYNYTILPTTVKAMETFLEGIL